MSAWTITRSLSFTTRCDRREMMPSVLGRIIARRLMPKKKPDNLYLIRVFDNISNSFTYQVMNGNTEMLTSLTEHDFYVWFEHTYGQHLCTDCDSSSIGKYDIVSHIEYDK